MLLSGAQKFLMGGFHFIKLESPFKQGLLEEDVLCQGLCRLWKWAPNPYTLHLTQSSSWWA